MENKYEVYWREFVPQIKRYLNSLYPSPLGQGTSKTKLKFIGGRKVSGHNFTVRTKNGRVTNLLRGSAPARGFRNAIIQNKEINAMLKGRHVEFRHTGDYVLEIFVDNVLRSSKRVQIAEGVFEELVNGINETGKRSDGAMSNFQQLRADGLERSRKASQYLFHPKSISIEEYYAFHYGGRTELQFNVGRDHYGGKYIFRYGIAFSLETSQWVHDASVFEPLIERFNEFVKIHPEYFEDCQMWIWNESERTPAVSVKKISKSNAKQGSFIFIGKYFDKDVAEIDSLDVQQIITEFNYLFPVYDFVQLNNETPIIPKIAKICWNDRGWQKPSGIEGKSKDPDAYERTNRFGHEEWLFNYDRLINGFHYAGLQPVNKTHGRYRGQRFDILLFTNNRDTATNHWVAEIKNVEILTEEQIKEVIKVYKKNKWLQTLEKDVTDAKGKLKAFRNDMNYLFNIRFKPENVIQFGNKPVEFTEDEHISHNRYTLLYRRPEQKLITDNNDSYETGLSFNENNRSSSGGRGRNQTAKFIQNRDIHHKIQKGFGQWLKENYQDDKIYFEVPNKASRTLIDIVRVRENGEHIFYEVKSYSNVRHSIRMALGQLLEYSLYPDQKLATQLVVVTHKRASPLDIRYIRHLNSLCSTVNIGYVHFDLSKNDTLQFVDNDTKVANL